MPGCAGPQPLGPQKERLQRASRPQGAWGVKRERSAARAYLRGGRLAAALVIIKAAVFIASSAAPRTTPRPSCGRRGVAGGSEAAGAAPWTETNAKDGSPENERLRSVVSEPAPPTVKTHAALARFVAWNTDGSATSFPFAALLTSGLLAAAAGAAAPSASPSGAATQVSSFAWAVPAARAAVARHIKAASTATPRCWPRGRSPPRGGAVSIAEKVGGTYARDLRARDVRNVAG